MVIFILNNIRPLSDDELRSNVPRVVTCYENKREVSVMQTLANKQVDRVFTFDKVWYNLHLQVFRLANIWFNYLFGSNLLIIFTF